MALYVYDGDRYLLAADMGQAQRIAREAIDVLRDCCDPEWPDSVETIAIYDAPEGDECPDEGRLIMRAVECDVRDDPTGQCDYWCDYKMEDRSG